MLLDSDPLHPRETPYKKMPQSGIVQALYAILAWACFFLMYFILGGYVKYNVLEGGAR